MSNLSKACIIGTAVLAASFGSSIFVQDAAVNFLIGMVYGALGAAWYSAWEN